MASKALAKVIYAYVVEEQFAMRVARLLIKIPFTSALLLEQVHSTHCLNVETRKISF